MTALVVTNVDPVDLIGFIDGSDDLQVRYGLNSLANFEQTLIARHEDLDSPTGIIRIKLVDFTHGGFTWTMNASHDGGSANWTRGIGHAYYDFVGPHTTPIDVDASATSNGTPSTYKPIFIKVQPVGVK